MGRIDRWLATYFTTPEHQVIGSLALFRILFGFLGLYAMQGVVPQDFEAARGTVWHPIAATVVFSDIPPQWLLLSAFFVLIASYVLLIVGLFTRLATLGALLGALLITGTRYSFGKVDHADTILLIYIPAVMLFYQWGNIYSLDARRRKQRGTTPPDPNTTDWQHGYPRRIILLVLCTLYTLSAFNKIVPPGLWLFDWTRISQFVTTSIDDSMIPQFNIFIAETLPVAFFLQVSVIVLEGIFWLGLTSVRWRHRVLVLGLCFHTFNMIVMNIGFTQMLWTYGFFVNWQWIATQAAPYLQRDHLPSIKLPTLPIVVWSTAAGLLSLVIATHYTFGDEDLRLWGLLGLPGYTTHVVAWLFAIPIIFREGRSFWRGDWRGGWRSPFPPATGDTLNHAVEPSS